MSGRWENHDRLMKAMNDQQGKLTCEQDLLEVLRRRAKQNRPRTTTAYLAAAANLRTDVALKHLGALELTGVVQSCLVRDGAEMRWVLNGDAEVAA